MPRMEDQLFFAPTDTKMAQVLAEADGLVHRFPEILRWIEADLDTQARAAKTLRLADQAYAMEQTLPLPLEAFFEKPPLPVEAVELELATGRPRTPAIVVYYFLVLRGHYGSVSSEQSWERFVDSVTLWSYLQRHVNKLPGRTTVLELLNAVSPETRALILDRQLAQARNEGLDDFLEQTIDSTAARANSAWPTDVELIQGLLERAFRVGRRLDDWEVRAFRPWHCPRWFDKLQSAKVELLLSKGGKRRRRRKATRRFIEVADKLLRYLHQEHDAREEAVARAPLPPSRRLLLDRLWGCLGEALADAELLLNYLCAKAIGGEEVTREEAEKIYSLSDGSAAFIVKGGRETVFGYKVQLGRSANGFISAVSVPPGNAADSGQLVEMVRQHVSRTGVVPQLVSADDGYASGPHERTLKTVYGVEDVSISGAKGRRQLGDELWQSDRYRQARADRSAVESLMFTTKHCFAFGHCHRRGLEAVREEVLEKAIAYNFWRLHHERTRQAAADEERRRLRRTG